MVLQFLCQFQQKGCELGSRWQRTWTSGWTHKPRNLPTLVRTEPETWELIQALYLLLYQFQYQIYIALPGCFSFVIYLFICKYIPVSYKQKISPQPKTITGVVWKFNKSTIPGQEIWIFLRFSRCKFLCSKVDMRPTR